MVSAAGARGVPAVAVDPNPLCRADAACRPLHIIKLPSIEAVNALSEQVSASAAARKNEEDSEDYL